MPLNLTGPLSGTYRIISKADTEGGAIYTLGQSKNRTTVEVAHSVVKNEIPEGTVLEPSAVNLEGPVFEIRKDDEFKVPVIRLAKAGELAEIDGPPEGPVARE